jgi:hypothetical protein
MAMKFDHKNPPLSLFTYSQLHLIWEKGGEDILIYRILIKYQDSWVSF